MGPSPSGTPVDLPGDRRTAIQDDLAARGVTDEITVVKSEAVTWPNGSLGCPQPGRMYTQAIEEGLWVIVEAGGEQYDYRFGRGGTPMLCEGIR
ncbi:hypothetical protein [Nigerium massiliense]|uniref:hypothetical protein n=1 Tax=Nigerium massiliense TaxID=1522317 RepID=UPI0006938F23|nr:hypothetical protein [Nigerium massiliense]